MFSLKNMTILVLGVLSVQKTKQKQQQRGKTINIAVFAYFS